MILVIFISQEDSIKHKFNNKYFSILNKNEMVLKKIRLSGFNFETKNNIITTSKLKIGKKIHLIDLDEIKNNIDNLSWVKNTEIIMYSGGLIDIKVEEHKPFAIYKNLEEYFLITDSGLKILEINNNEFEEYFIITGENALDALFSLKEIILLLKRKFINIEKAVHIDSRRWNIYFAEGFLVKLPAENTGFILQKFINLKFKDLDYGKISYIDLRIPDRITIKEK